MADISTIEKTSHDGMPTFDNDDFMGGLPSLYDRGDRVEQMHAGLRFACDEEGEGEGTADESGIGPDAKGTNLIDIYDNIVDDEEEAVQPLVDTAPQKTELEDTGADVKDVTLYNRPN